jgi:hypothetical protein
VSHKAKENDAERRKYSSQLPAIEKSSKIRVKGTKPSPLHMFLVG